MAWSALRSVAISPLLFSLLNAGTGPNIITTQLPPATIGIFYSASLAATGGSPAYSWSVAFGQLPTGLKLDPSSGTIAGTPTVSSSFQPPGNGSFAPVPLVFQVTDSAGLSNTANLPISVADPVVITTASIPSGTVGSSYFFCMAAQGGLLAYAGSWSIVSGALPAGLTLASNLNCPGVAQYHNPAITGTPAQAGSFPVTLQASDFQGRSAQQSYNIVVNPTGTPPQSLILTPPSLTFTAQANGQAPAPQTVLVELSSGSLGFSAMVTQGADWLSVTTNGSTTPAALTVSVNPTALSAGPFSGMIQVTAPGSPNSPQNLPVTLTTNVTSSPSKGIYGAGSTISIQVSFIGAVTVTGTPQLALNSGGTAVYSSGSGTPTLTFTYVVGANDISSHLDYSSTEALTGGMIDADLTLAPPGMPGSLGANSNLVIGAAPPAPFFTGEVSLGGGTYYLQFPNGSMFGDYSLEFFPILYHYALGYESFVDAHDPSGGAYLYDFASGHWFYTSPSLFPDLYDFTLNLWLYYFTNTTHPRYFANLTTQQIFTM